MRQSTEITDSVFQTESGALDSKTNGYDHTFGFRKRCASAPSERDVEQNEFMKNVFFDVCSDFERTLERASVRQSRRRRTVGKLLTPSLFSKWVFMRSTSSARARLHPWKCFLNRSWRKYLPSHSPTAAHARNFN